MLLRSAAVSVVILVIFSFSGSNGQVPTPPLPCLYDPLGNIVAGICFNDCIQEHGAINGTCNPNNICVCHYQGDNLAPLPNFTIATPLLDPLAMLPLDPVQQCLVDDRNVPIIGTLGIFYNVYQDGCNLDCQCVHGANSGTCNFTSNQCHCHYPSNGTFLNVNNYACQYCIPGEAVNVLGNLFNKIALTLANLLQNVFNFPIPGFLTLIPPLNVGKDCGPPPV